jgi:hypothetical protein
MPVRLRRAALLITLAALALASGAEARIGPAATIDGPAPEILELGGVAMAPDGTGGLVYRRSAEGRTHVFAARFDGTSWSPPQRVDVGQPFNSAWPRIAAADGGRLVVAWTQDGGEGLDGLWAASLPAGRSRFLPPTLVDFNIGEDLATHPSIAMNGGGDALIVYRAIRSFEGGGLPQGFVSGDVRLARFDGSRWQRFGVPVNRNRNAPQRAPTADNAPRVALEASGNGVVAWHEPDDDLVDRVWARRVFGTRTGFVQAASPLREGGQLVRGGADQLALDQTALGRVVVAYRQLPDPRDRSAAARVFVNQMDESSAETAGGFNGPELVGAAGSAAPSLALAGREDAWMSFPRGGLATLAHRPGIGPFAVREHGDALDAPPPVVEAGLEGRGVIAAATGGGGGDVVIRELNGTTPTEIRPVFTALGGPVRELSIAGSGRGDAIVAFAQGPDGDRQIATAIVDAAPSSFALTLPPWTRQRRPNLSWDRAFDALGPVSYTISIRGRRVARTGRTRLRLREGTLRQGRHRVRVVARDRLGQTTAARPDWYRLDRQAPLTRLRRRGRRVTARIVDPGGRRASGPGRELSSVDWGDQSSSDFVTRRARHRYRRPGRYRLTIIAVDQAGNRVVLRRRVRIN